PHTYPLSLHDALPISLSTDRPPPPAAFLLRRNALEKSEVSKSLVVKTYLKVRKKLELFGSGLAGVNAPKRIFRVRTTSSAVRPADRKSTRLNSSHSQI